MVLLTLEGEDRLKAQRRVATRSFVVADEVVVVRVVVPDLDAHDHLLSNLELLSQRELKDARTRAGVAGAVGSEAAVQALGVAEILDAEGRREPIVHLVLAVDRDAGLRSAGERSG